MTAAFSSTTPLTRRRAFTVWETMAAVSLLLVAMVLVVQVAFWSMEERRRSSARQEALETAANLLESAHALPHESLTLEWAEQQRMPESLASRLQDGTMTVRVEPEPKRAHTKRVTVHIAWQRSESIPAKSVKLTALFAARSAGGGKP